MPVLAVPTPPAVATGAAVPSLPEEFARPGLSIEQIVTIVFAYWKLTAAIALTVTLIAAGVIKMLPKLYTGQATLLVNYEINDPLAGKEFPIALLASYVSTQIEIMQSPDVLTRVVDKLDLLRDEDFIKGYSAGRGTSLHNWVKDELAKRLTINLGASPQLIYVRASARTAQQAAQIANTVAETYLEQHRERSIGPATERAERYTAQLTELKAKVTQAQEQVAAFRQRTGITEVTATNNDIEEALLSSLEQKLQEAQNQRREMEVRLLGTQLSANASSLKSNMMEDLKADLATQEAQLAQLRTTLGSQHPRILELQSQIAATRRSMENEVQDFSAGASRELVQARQLEEKLRKAADDQRKKVLNLRNIQDEGAKLQLELESAQSVYKRALDGYDQIMFTSVGHYSNVNFVTKALPPVKADKPNKLKLMAMGIIAGGGLGLLFPVAYELLVNRRVRCRDDIERDFGIGVLAEFSAIPATGSVA